jgi:hypothetical protein
VKSRCKSRANAESWCAARFRWQPSLVWDSLFRNALILLIVCDSGGYESPSARLDSSYQIPGGTILKAQKLQAIPNRDETVVLNLRTLN